MENQGVITVDMGCLVKPGCNWNKPSPLLITELNSVSTASRDRFGKHVSDSRNGREDGKAGKDKERME